MEGRAIAGWLMVLVLAMPAPTDASADMTLGARQAVTVVPRVGIGRVHLGERRTRVERQLGPGHVERRGVDRGSVRYRSGAIAILVSYDGRGRVDGVMTHARRAILYGHRLGAGLAKLRPVIRAHHWKIFSCRGETFTFVLPAGPGTGIAWRSGRLDEVFVTGGGSVGEECLPMSYYE